MACNIVLLFDFTEIEIDIKVLYLFKININTNIQQVTNELQTNWFPKRPASFSSIS